VSLSKTPRKYTKPRKTYRDALTANQIPKMESFIRTLVVGVFANKAGVKVDIGRCIDAWR